MTETMWTYPDELREALLGFGLAPEGDTPPRFVRDHLSDLYRHEIRHLRARLLAGEFPKAEYASHVIALRGRYWPLRFTPDQWERICSATATTRDEIERNERTPEGFEE